ncbi:Transcriptional regulatory protein DcuR [compost metagenome]
MINVLIVEDDPMVAKFNQCYLEQIEGYHCVGQVASAEAAEGLLEEQQIDLILLDIYMRQKSGFELLNLIRSNAANVDVIVISALKDPGSIKKALQYGAIDYLIKPFSFARFKVALENYREVFLRMNSDENMSQDDLDKLTRPLFHNNAPVHLPKGLTSGTLGIVWKAIQQYEGNFSTDEIALLSGISRVSMGKYLSFLTDINVLETETIYGTGGRPMYKYHLIPDKEAMVENYLG